MEDKIIKDIRASDNQEEEHQAIRICKNTINTTFLKNLNVGAVHEPPEFRVIHELPKWWQFPGNGDPPLK